MAKRPSVPKFGNWENEAEPYTVYFDQARKHKGGKAVNPNDPEHYPEMFKNNIAKNRDKTEEPATRNRVQTEEPATRRSVRPLMNDGGGYANSPARNDKSSRGRGSNSSGRAPKQSGGGDHSFDKSPLHPQLRPKAAGGGGRGVSGSSYDSSHGGGSAAVPRFGAWDDVNPQSAENYTEIFNRVREARRQDSADVSSSRPSFSSPKQEQHRQKCCFPWW